MQAYLGPVHTAMLIFPFLAALLALPFLIYHYHRYGSLYWFRAVVLYTFIFYLLCAYFLVILPLPPRSVVANLTTIRYNLHPFQFARSFLADSVWRPWQLQTYLPAMKQNVFIQPAFNIFLTLPFGVYLHYYFKHNWFETLLLSFCLSLFFELTQLTGLYFIYPRPYRLFDIDDLFLNTLGGTLGYFVTPLLVWLFPTRQAIDQESFKQGQQVSYLRRFVAWFIDLAVVMGLLELVLEIIFQHLQAPQLASLPVVYGLSVLLLQIILPYFWHGQTVGKWLVRLKIVTGDDQRVGWWQLVWRQAWLYLGILPLFYFWLQALAQTGAIPASALDRQLVLIAAMTILLGIMALHVLLSQLMHRPQLFYEKISHTKEVSSIAKNQPNSESNAPN